MAKYEVNQTRIITPNRTFNQGEVVVEKDFTDAGSQDFTFFKESGAIKPLKGTEDIDEVYVDPNQGTDPVAPGATPDTMEAVRALEADSGTKPTVVEEVHADRAASTATTDATASTSTRRR